MSLTNITIGADPELAITHKDKVKSAIGIIPGHKDDAYTEGLPSGYSIQIDNVMAEYCIPPCTTLDAWLNHHNYMKEWIRTYVKNIDSNYDIKCLASEKYTKKDLEHPIAQLFGCSPDYDVYTETANTSPDGSKTRLRSAGFHIHIGYDYPNYADSVQLVRYLDVYLGIPSILYDTDTQRRALYGKAGAFRLCDYGVEYRVLSGAFLENDSLLIFIWKQVHKAIKACNHNVPLPDSVDVIATINNSDLNKAKEIIQKYKLI